MSLQGQLILRQITRLKKKKRYASAPQIHRTSRSYFDWQYETSKKKFSLYQGLNLEGKTVLDVGCGIGGRTAWLANSGAAHVTGIDVNGAEITEAKKLAAEKLPNATNIDFRHVGNDIGDIGQFEIVILTDALEHVVSPANTMRQMHQLTKAGGQCFASAIGFYHYNGSHFDDIPFQSILFSDNSTLDHMRWKVSQPDYEPTIYDSEPPIDRWRGLYDIRDRPGEYLNKLTLRQMKKLARYSLFSKAQVQVIGFERQFPGSGVVNLLRNIPIVQEVLHSYVVISCQK